MVQDGGQILMSANSVVWNDIDKEQSILKVHETKAVHYPDIKQRCSIFVLFHEFEYIIVHF